MDDLISEFITEATESLEVLDSELVNLEQNPNDEKILGNIFRLVHTIKGTCGFLGLPRLESVAHAGENVLGKFRDGEVEVDAGAVSIILEALDCITMVVEHLSETGEEPEGDDSDLIARLNAYADGKGSTISNDANNEDENKNDNSPILGSESGLSAEELQALEDAFNNTEFDGNLDNSSDETPNTAANVPEPVEKPKPKPKTTPQTPPKAKAKKQAVEKGLQSAANANTTNQTIRVNIGVLEGLMSMVGELVLTRNQLGQMVRNSSNEEFKAPLQRLSMITSELQEGVMKTRMQPIGNAWSKFPRLIRDLSIDLNKKIELRMEGAETELDRQMLEMIKDPLTHMVRNSCDHGLESPEKRIAAGKPEVGIVKLSAYHEGGHIIVKIADNGNGVNIDLVKQKAIDSGLATIEEMNEYSDHQIAQFIFKAGFSTAAEVTSVSGRGVGMDVVRTNIESIGGTVSLESVPGKGSTFYIKIPLTLAIVSVLVVETAGERFGVPQINVVELVRAGDGLEHKIEVINNASVLRLRDQLLPLISLADTLGLSKERDEIKAKKREDEETFGDIDYEYIVVCRIGATDYGLIVDVVYDTEEIVVKPVSECLSSIPVYSGNTVLGDGSVIMILDPNGIAKTTSKELDNKKDDSDNKIIEEVKRSVSFLLFSNGDTTPKAVPLELLSRLEELDANTIEYSSGNPVVQYNGGLMRLTTLDDREIPTEGISEVVVFNYDGQSVGLIVEQILDIVESELDIKASSSDDTYIGSIVIDGKTTDVVDIGNLLSNVLNVTPELESMEGLEDIDIEEHKDSQILFVEDSMFFRNLTVPFLSSAGYKVTATPSAADALHLLNKNDYDLIVTDIEMPDMNGFELAKEIRATHRNPDIPIIAFTSTMNAEFDYKMRDAGIDAGASKTEREKLILAIAKHLSKVTA